MFELSVACKYLRPRWRQLSVSIISLISILVIALVVWLIVVFFSVTSGLEKRWIEKLIALTAPVRLTPTETYYNSYYYQIDSISENSNYTLKTIGEKWRADQSDPYDPQLDVEVPFNWPAPDREEDGSLKDPVKKAFSIIKNLPYSPSIKARDYEVCASNLRLRMLRKTPGNNPTLTQAFLSQATYLGSLDNENLAILKATLPISDADINNLLYTLSIASENIQEDHPASADSVNQQLLRERLKTFFKYTEVNWLKTPPAGWALPTVLQKNALLPKQLPGGFQMRALPILESLDRILYLQKILFDVSFEMEGHQVSGRIPMGNLLIAHPKIKTHFNNSPPLSPFWFYKVGNSQEDLKVFLPKDAALGEGILLPKPFREAGVLLGDRGYISFQAPTVSALQEQRIQVFVAGFYDQGLIPVGGKFILVNEALTNLIASAQHNSQAQSNGINLRFSDLSKVDEIYGKLQQAFKEAGIAPYWKIETYRDYDFTKDIIQQLRSDKHLFTLIAIVIIIVACSNVISMLIILVNDKKLEIGILRSMGASSASIAGIFGFCGMTMGLAGSVIGIGAALFTLRHLELLVTFLSRLQGHEAFNPLYYGDSLPNEVSMEALLYVISFTALISLFSGLVPALKASLLRPSTILRAE
ncbi:Uncharacterized protein NEOC65_000655 [Neochlamydia sp. AcF65]|uniref:ABC transporter permease n=1 Tax=Neochlamydia sp. AcF65 TaxID=2795735 RepID=UPI001BCA3281|nr:FtsX-like permease family protein [Neochlamydia sp. AcF65]MBS4165593.1 Uncharacterized protein [Neochlamydia sp. AcF65]